MFNLPDSMLRGARLDAVAKQVAAASATNRLIYVERRGNLYRWSLTHRGGPYPLLRETAKLLGIDFHTIILPFRTLPTGLAIVDAEPKPSQPADRWMVLEFESAESVEKVCARIRKALVRGLA